MRLTVSQLRRIIKEEVTNVMDGGAELGAGDDVVSDEEFDMIVTEASRLQRPQLNETFLGYENLSIGGIIAAFAFGAYMGSGLPEYIGDKVESAVKRVVEHMKATHYMALKAHAAELKKKGLADAILSLSDDQVLASMFDELAALRGTGTKAEVSALSKQITEYVKANMAQTGAKPMDVRMALQNKRNAPVR